MAQRVPQPTAARQDAGEVRQEVAAEDHVDPGVDAAVEAGQEGGERHGGVLRVCRQAERTSSAGKCLYCRPHVYRTTHDVQY